MKSSIKILSLLVVVTMLMFSCTSNQQVAETTKTEETTTVAETTTAKETNPVLSNEIFKIDVPSKFDGLYNTKVNDHSIDFYDKESMDAGNPGWVFGVQAFEGSDSWAGGPVEKFGELKLNNGKVYDIVISYPTESQYGFSDDGTIKEMPNKYKTLYDGRFEIAEAVSGNGGEKVEKGAGAKGENIYQNVLDKHLKAIKESWDAEKLEKEKISTMYIVVKEGGDVMTTVGYAYKDINIDGIDELLIGEISNDGKGMIYDIYTVVDKKPTHVISGWDRNRYYVLDGGLVRNEYSNGANESGVNIYNLTSNSTELFLQVAYKYDGYTDEKKPWFKSYNTGKDDKNDWESIEESEYNELDERFGKISKIDYKAFSTLNQ